MALSTCAKCGGTIFELQESEPVGSTFVLYFVQCSKCGAPVGALEYHNTGALIGELGGLIKALDQKVDQLTYEVRVMDQKIATRG